MTGRHHGGSTDLQVHVIDLEGSVGGRGALWLNTGALEGAA